MPAWRRHLATLLAVASALLALGSAGLFALRYVPPDAAPVSPDRLAMATAFTDLGVAGAVLAALVALLAALLGRGRARTVVAAACAGLAVVPVAVLAPRWVPAPAGAGRGSFSVLALNTLYGQADPDVLAGVAASSDVVVLTEATEPLARALAARGFTERFERRCGGRLPGQGPSGTVVYSRFPVTTTRPLSTDLDNQAWVCAVDLPGSAEPLTVVAVHPSRPFPQGARWLPEQTELRAQLPTEGPRLLAGDFNAVASHPTQRALVADGWASAVDQAGAGWVPTYPAGRTRLPPLIDIDHVYVAGGLQARTVRPVTVPGSDHRGLVVTVDLVQGS